VDECDVHDKDALEAFRAKRDEWIDALAAP